MSRAKAIRPGESTVGIVGAGTMGSGIALAALYAGYRVILQDAYPGALDHARPYIEKFLAKKDLGARIAQITFTESLEDLSPADILIEAIIEELEAKQALFKALDAICPEAILASNTSTLPVTAIAAAVSDPGRVVGMHFFNPAPVLPLVEVVRAAQTRPEVLAATVALAESLGKTPVVTGDTPGFIVNRVARPFYGEALRIVGEGIATVEQVDVLVEGGAGFRMGPFKLMDLIGIDINATAMQSMHEQTFGEARYRPHWLQMQKMQAGTLGRKSGRGFYMYDSTATDESGHEPERIAKSMSVLALDGAGGYPLLKRLTEAGHVVNHDVALAGEADIALVLAEDADAIVEEVNTLTRALALGTPILVPGALHTHAALCSLTDADPAMLVSYDSLFVAEATAITLTGTGHDAVDDLFRSAGLPPEWVADAPGMVLPRIVCMLINEAAFAVQDQVADAATIDKAMQLGVNYPQGLLAWGEALGWARVLAVLEHLQAEYGEDRYRPCRLIRQWVRVGMESA